ncbi:MAG: RNA polymerase factor sigma-54 [Pseudomonadota bacterium]
MALSPRLDLKQSQQLVMTPQLQQAIKLLQLTNLEITQFLASELEKNPLLEIAQGDTDRGADDRLPQEGMNGIESGGESPDGDLKREPAADDFLTDQPGKSVNDQPVDADFNADVFHHDAAIDQPQSGSLSLNGEGGGAGSGLGSWQGDDDSERQVASAVTLTDHLLEQLRIAAKTQRELIIGQYLCDLVDANGYIQVNLAEVADRLGAPLEAVEGVLEMMQRFDPSGVCARSLSECLKIQQRDRNRLDPAMELLLDNLDRLGRQDMVELKRICEVGDEDLMDMIEEIRELDPRPGLAFDHRLADAVVPDIFLSRSQHGIWQVELNTDTLPRVLVNRRYHTELSTRSSREEDKVFLSECLANANWLVKALDQRAQTILKVSSEIVRLQEGFFEHGLRHLKPLTLRMIAEAVDMHESTISRVTSNKYIATNRGVFELKFFFTTSIPSTARGDDAHSSTSVRDRIREMIEKEDVDAVLSDDKIVELLRVQGVEIARRTVAKYREAMGIQSSVQRRRAKRLAAAGKVA